MASCLIIDDEPLSRDVLRKFIAEVRDLDLLGECGDAFEASSRLANESVDLIFLDINMPGFSGLSLARSLKDPPLIVFTTAYPQFAVEGFELDALDYLVKPYSFERFLKAVNRALDRLSTGADREQGGRKLMVRADRKLYALDPLDIIFVEGQGDYIRLHLSEKRLVVHDTIKSFLESLPGEHFMRVHKSYVVNLGKIAFMEGNMLNMGEETIPVSPAYRDDLLERYSAL